MIRAKNDWFIFTISIMISYTSGLIFMTKEPIPLNYTGWLCIALFTTLTFSKSIKHLREQTRILKLFCIGKPTLYVKKRNPVSPQLLSQCFSTL